MMGKVYAKIYKSFSNLEEFVAAKMQ